MTDKAKKPRSRSAAAPPEASDAGWDAEPLFVPHLDEIEALSRELVDHPESENAYAEILESQCGATDDSQPVEQYDGTLGVTVAFVNAHQRPVGQVQWNANLAGIYTNPGNVSGVRWGTGTLISNDLFLTAGHLFDQTGGGWQRPRQNGTQNIIEPAEIATNMHVNFDYQVDASGQLRQEQSFQITALVEYRLGSLDFAVVRLAGNPGLTFGTTRVSTTDAAQNAMICIIGHPAGQPKRIEAGPVFDLHGDRIGYDDIDTLGGNSGSGILRASDGRIVGVHTNGGCTTSGTGHNHGVRITSIIAQSPTLQAITTPKLKAADDPTTLKFTDDGGRVTRKFTDDGRVSTLKFRDDGGGVATRKFTDDGGGIPTRKFTDDGGTLKSYDDVKQPARDKMFSDRKIPGRDAGPVDPRVGRPVPRRGGERPFILSTPHHSMAWAGAGGAGPGDEVLAEYEAQLEQLEQLMQQAAAELEALEEQYQALYEEYQAVAAGQG